jgi:hypothetical protein
MFALKKFSPFEVKFWAVVFLAAGLLSGLYILIFGAPEPVLSSDGKRTLQWYLHSAEQRYGRFLTAGALTGFGVICAGLTKLFPYGDTG